jgi:hypothetical protein
MEKAMIPEKESLMLFEEYAPLQTRFGKHLGILLKGDGLGTPEYVPQFKDAINKLSAFYKPHMIKHSNYWRWSFAIPIEQDGDHHTGVNLVLEWHRNSNVEYMTINIKRKIWERGHEPPCLWRR